MIDPQPDPRPTCEVCGQPVQGESIDLWALVTWYTENGDVAKTGIELQSDYIKRGDDYIVIGDRCCGVTMAGLWNDFISKLRRAKEHV